MNDIFDVAVIGGGPAGIAAAVAASGRGARVALFEREGQLGGILKQCIHDGFGLFKFGESITGPEYGYRYQQMMRNLPVKIFTSTFLTELRRRENGFILKFVSPQGTLELEVPAVITATGCRERSGRQVFLHGDRPSGIFTAGQAQGFVNLYNALPGRRCVILGSGDIGLIMARRLTLEGVKVEGVYEIKSEPSGLTRNIVQCLEDFSIPLHLSTTVREIHGRRRIEAVTVCRVDEKMREIPGFSRRIECDTLILSVGLIPENEILDSLDVFIDPDTHGPRVNQDQMTGIPGLFTCGNAQHVNDLVDYVSESGEIAGRAAAEYSGTGNHPVNMFSGSIPVESTGELLYQVPGIINLKGRDPVFYFRTRRTMKRGELSLSDESGRILYSRRYTFLRPPEMERFTLSVSAIPENTKKLILNLKEAGL